MRQGGGLTGSVDAALSREAIDALSSDALRVQQATEFMEFVPQFYEAIEPQVE
jgi:hypothetical protein